MNPTNERLADLTGLPNLDAITDPARLDSLVDIAYRKMGGMLQQGGSPLRYQAAAKLYAERAADQSVTVAGS